MKKNLQLGLLFMLTVAFGKAQTYNFSTTTDSYSNLSGSMILTTPGDAWDEYRISLGMNFEFFGQTFDSLTIDADGDVWFSEDTTDESIIDLIGATLDEHSTLSSAISYKTEGVSPNKIVKIEWKNAGFWDNQDVDYANLQLWLYEGSNKIEMRYGNSSITDLANDFENSSSPICGIVSYDGNSFYFLGGNPANPMVNDPNNDSLNSMPASGRVYIFTPVVTTINDIGDENSFTLYPNPSEGEFTVSVNTVEENSISAISVYNSIGQMVYSNNSDHKTKKNSVDLTELPKGIYSVNVKSIALGASKVYSRKIIIR